MSLPLCMFQCKMDFRIFLLFISALQHIIIGYIAPMCERVNDSVRWTSITCTGSSAWIVPPQSHWEVERIQYTNSAISVQRDFCRQHGGHLVHINDAAENAFLKDHITRSNSGDSYWIGLTDKRVEGLWYWYDTDTSPTFTDWNYGSSEPNGGYGENCAHFYLPLHYKWNDKSCRDLDEPICEQG